MATKTITQFPQIPIVAETDEFILWDKSELNQRKCFPFQIPKSYHIKTRYLVEYTSINAAITDIGANVIRLVISGSDTQRTTTGNLSIPENIEIVTEPGSPIIDGGGHTLTIGNFRAGLYQVFSGFSAGDVTIDRVTIYPQWWGALGGVGSNDDTVAINDCFASVRDGGSIYFPQGIYKTTATLTMAQDGVKIFGPGGSIDGFFGAVIKGEGVSGPVFKYEAETAENVMRDMFVYGDSNCDQGILWGNNCRNHYLENVIVQNCSKVGANGFEFGSAGSQWGIKLVSCFAYNNYNGYKIDASTNNISLAGCKATQNDNYGLWMVRPFSVSVLGGNYESNAVHDFHLEGVNSVTIQDIYSEASYGGAFTLADYRVFFITSSAGVPCTNLRLVNNLCSTSNPTDTAWSDYAVEIENSAFASGEISYCNFFKVNNEFIKNGSGNYGLAINNIMRARGLNEGVANSTLFDNELGFNIINSLNNDKSYVQSNNHRRNWTPAGTTADLVTLTVPEDSSMYLEAWALWRKQTTADTNIYKILYVAVRDGAGAPTVTQVTREENEDIAGQNFLFAADGNDVDLQFVAAVGNNGQVEFGYKVINIVETA
jgi:hypothetical protein